MANNVVSTRIQERRDTEANWKASDPVLLLGEVAISSDKRLHKVGDGTSKWSALQYNNAINASNCTGNSASATKLASARTIQTNLNSTSSASFDGTNNISPGVTGTLPVGNGGTGQTSGVNAANYFINSLSEGTSTPTDNDYYVSQYVGGGTSTTTYHRRPVSALWEYIKGKISSVLGLTASAYKGNAATSTKLAAARTITNSGDLTGSYNFDGSGNVTASSYIYNCTAFVGSTNNYPYHRIAKTDVISDAYQDNAALLYVAQDYNGGGFGIIRISIRTNSGSAVSSATAEWLVRKDLSEDSIQIGFYNVFGKTYADIFYKSNGAYSGLSVRALEGSRANIGRNKIVLVNSTEANDTTTSDAKTSKECYASIAVAGTALHSQAYTNTVSGVDMGAVKTAASATKASTATTADIAVKVKDSNDGKDLSITYSKAGQSATSWLASWNGYELGAISPDNVYVKKVKDINDGKAITFTATKKTSVARLAGWNGYELDAINASDITAGKAENDVNGKSITGTYIKDISANGTTLTLTRGNDFTEKITTQDTTYSTGTASTAGLTKLYTSTGGATDGTMTQNAINNALNGKTKVTIARWS